MLTYSWYRQSGQRRKECCVIKDVDLAHDSDGADQVLELRALVLVSEEEITNVELRTVQWTGSEEGTGAIFVGP